MKSKRICEMMRLFKILTFLIGFIVTGPGYSGEVEIVDVKVTCSNNCNFAVTLKHADEGWQHYANQWDVLTMDGELLKSRVLFHPHVDEQPFTRSLSGVQIPAGTNRVKIRARDLKHGYSNVEFTVQLP